ncbi:MAG: retropepsin-like aspartic protease [Pseudomonadota bacterium]
MRRTGQTFLLAGVWLGLGLLLYVFFLRQEAPPPRLVGADAVELQRGRDGHFHIDGRIGGEPVRFLIDTGASAVSVSEALARRAGLGCERAATFNTANGTVRGCTTRAATLEIGPFQLRDVAVVVLPNLDGNALLGMNVLRHLDMRQEGERLRLSLPSN